MEKQIVIKARDGKSIYLVYNQAGNEPSKKIVVMGHGLLGRVDSYLLQMARIFFNKNGYDVARVSFYSEAEGARNLHNATLQLQANDLNDVIAYFKPAYQDVYAAGHSYGGLTMVFAQPQVNAVAFWDPSFVPWVEFWEKDLMELCDGKLKALHWGGINIIGQEMVDEAKALTLEKAQAMASKITPPSLVVTAELEDRLLRKELFDALTCEKETIDVKKAGHCFTEEMTVNELLQKTYDWFERF